jgi:hypothetical protein
VLLRADEGKTVPGFQDEVSVVDPQVERAFEDQASL